MSEFFVLDSSVTLTWCFRSDVERALRRMQHVLVDHRTHLHED